MQLPRTAFVFPCKRLLPSLLLPVHRCCCCSVPSWTLALTQYVELYVKIVAVTQYVKLYVKIVVVTQYVKLHVNTVAIIAATNMVLQHSPQLVVSHIFAVVHRQMHSIG